MKQKITFRLYQLSQRVSCIIAFIACVTLHANAAVFAGSGTEEDPFLITDADELYMVRSYTGRSYFFRLENDIDLTEFISENFPENGWSPIGSSSSPFCGTFDGNGKTISGLTINNSTGNGLGLFGYFRGILKNLTVKGAVVGNDNIGGIVGLAELYSSTEATSILDCRFEGSVSGHSGVGGIVGRMNDQNHTRYLNIRRCGVKGTVVGSNYYIGGVVGSCSGHEIQECWMSGEIKGSMYCGGICGYAHGRLLNCYAKCNIGKINALSSLWAGGIVGWLEGHYYNGNFPAIIKCQYVGDIIGDGQIGGIAYRADATIINDNIVRGTLVSTSGSSSRVGGVVVDMHRAILNNSYRYNSINSNIVACTTINVETTASTTTNSAARITNSIEGHTIGAEGSTSENLALSTMDITLNGTAVATTDYARHGTGATMSFLKKKLCYTAKNWDFDTTWAIDADLNDGFPYLQSMESVIRELEADDEGGETTAISNATTTASSKKTSGIYTLDGRKISEPTQKGIYIHDGRKVVLK